MTSPAPTPAPETPRLSPYALHRLVAEFLLDNTGSHSPTAIAKALGGRSSGAVGNALDRLTEAGQAALTSPAPRRYAATPTTGDALAIKAGTLPPKAPPAPPVPAAVPPKPAPPAVPATTPDGGIIRPSGQVYRPRKLADLPDVEVLRKLRAAEVPVLLYGPPGTGKTSVIEAAFGEDLITIAGDGDTQVGDLIGEYTQTPTGRYEFVYGPLICAMQEGKVLLVDDATLISPAVLAAMYPAMDGRKRIVVKAHKGETIEAKPGFYIIAGHNPGVHGAILTEALSSRFSVQIEVSTDFDLATKLDIDRRAVTVARNLHRRRESGDIGWSPQLRELIAFQKIVDVLGVPAAAANLIGVAPTEDRPTVAETVEKAFGAKLTPLALGKQI
ncbi:AAA domain (dynein-related subfamily) [Parafrankia irregularis]|uniref:AAA domain (Dynein-related subfamily) n=1 Tax=Parafrankia irregularis TaxID=795642 RepID=A0A0S4R0M3_9ACTN|nr:MULTISPECIES: AAA family ATPase [Frankiaceae]KPM50317.1 ATPase AAA [Frankia sp. R43]MBE3204702.1 AAA family ATPase [Parafrankia sp. CH37]CUU60894.1 AAA domain (dynein-related subfamily) [Parafrankia irregularis]